jgi:hypothetical protein
MIKKFSILSFVLLFIGGSSLLTAQQVERKVIVENGQYYYVTIDEMHQIGTLYIGKYDQPLHQSKAFGLPAGRGISAQTNPLAWDLADTKMYAVNFLDHSLNDRNEAIKRFEISGLKEWSTNLRVEDLLMESAEKNMYVLNEPYLFIKSRSKFLNNFYFDGIYFDNAYWMVITNNDELTIWKYANEEWKHSEVKKFPVTGFFSLVVLKKSLHLMTNSGEIYQVTLESMGLTSSSSINLNEYILIDDRDEKVAYYMKNNSFNFEKSLKTQVIEKAIKLN